MISSVTFAKGMALLAVNFNREPSQELADMYYRILGGKLDDEQWQTALHAVIEKETFYPPVATLLKYGLPPVSHAARAGEVYEQIAEAYENLTGHEKEWSPSARQVEERWGRAAKDAFMAAGGPRKFEWCEPEDEPFRLKAFREAFVETADSNAAFALPAAPERLLR